MKLIGVILESSIRQRLTRQDPSALAIYPRVWLSKCLR